MFSSLSILSSSTRLNSTSSTPTEVLSADQNQNFEEKIPLTSKEEVQKKLSSILTQVQQNQLKHLDLTPASVGRFYEQANTLSGHQDVVCCLAVLPNGQLISGSLDATIKLWDLASHSCLSTLQEHDDPVYDMTVATLPNGQLASGSYDKTIKLWGLASRSCLFTLHGHTDSVWVLAVLPNGQLASGSYDKTIKLWDLASRSCLSTLHGHTNAVHALAVLPNSLLASGSWDHTIKLWDLASHSCLSTLRGHASDINALVAFPNGQLASSSRDTTIKLWDLSSHSCISTLQGHISPVLSLAALPNGLLASGSSDKTIKLWDLASRTCLSTLQGHSDAVYTLTVLPNGQLVSGSSDNTIKLWASRSLSAQQLRPIFNALRNNTSVMDLDLSGNRNIVDDIIDPLIEIFKRPGFFSLFDPKPNTSLKTIDLRKTRVSKKGLKKLEKAIQYQRLSIEVLADCPIEWMMIYFLIVFCRANRNSPFADSGLDLCKYGEMGSFLGVPSGFFARLRKKPSSFNNYRKASTGTA